jgi:hypothetical protein
MDKNSTLKSLLMQRMSQTRATTVWTAVDFIDLGKRDAIDKTLQRMVTSGDLRRIDRGLFDLPKQNPLTGKLTTPDYRHVIEAVGRRDQVRILIDGITAANDLGLTNAVPGQIIVHTDGRLRSIRLHNLIIKFKLTAPSKLYWAGRPAMRIVQALHWLRNCLKADSQVDQITIKTKLVRLLQDSNQAQTIYDDLQFGLNAVPAWMQKWIQELLAESKKPTNKR